MLSYIAMYQVIPRSMWSCASPTRTRYATYSSSITPDMSDRTNFDRRGLCRSTLLWRFRIPAVSLLPSTFA